MYFHLIVTSSRKLVSAQSAPLIFTSLLLFFCANHTLPSSYTALHLSYLRKKVLYSMPFIYQPTFVME
jgi:hypothetical protein